MSPQDGQRKVSRPITFGVEIEAILAFEQERLQSVLDRYYTSCPATIIKSFPDSAHATLLMEDERAYTCRNLYPSWALLSTADPNSDPSLKLLAQQATSVDGRSGKARRYLAEPLIIAREALGTTSIPFDICALLRRGSDTVLLPGSEQTNPVTLLAQSPDYNMWTLTTDHSLIGCVSSQLHQAIGDTLYDYQTVTDPDSTTRTIQEKKWDSSGIELISPVFTYQDKHTAFASITESLERLSQNSEQKLLPSVWASLQVHIGLDVKTPQEISISLLQHLAYILLCHEDLLSKLHPRSRCGLKLKETQTEIVEDNWNDDDMEDFDPDFDYPPEPEKTPAEIAAEDEEYLRQNDANVLKAEASYTGYNTTSSNLRYFCHATSSTYPPTPEHVASHIFQSEMSVPQLISLLQKPSPSPQSAAKGHRHRGYMYNFDNILTMALQDKDTWKSGKPTIEFRQHACSVNADEVKRWVELCFAIVKLAERMAEKAAGASTQAQMWQEEAEKYGNVQWPCETVDGFLGGCLGLDGDDVEYWKGRYERYKDDRPTASEIDPLSV